MADEELVMERSFEELIAAATAARTAYLRAEAVYNSAQTAQEQARAAASHAEEAWRQSERTLREAINRKAVFDLRGQCTPASGAEGMPFPRDRYHPGPAPRESC